MAATWYYVDRGQTRQGPVEAEALVQAHARGEVDDTSLAWREGLAQWAPLGQFRDELGLPASVGVPNMPPPGAPPAYIQNQGQYGEAPPKKRSGCLIAAIVLGGAAVFLVPVLAILAAIALPAYQDYIARSQTTTGLADIRGGVIAFEELIQRDTGTPASPGEIGLADSTARCSSIEVQGSFDLESTGQSISCTIQGNPKVSGAVVSLARTEDGAWECTVMGAEALYLPTGCSPY